MGWKNGLQQTRWKPAGAGRESRGRLRLKKIEGFVLRSTDGGLVAIQATPKGPNLKEGEA